MTIITELKEIKAEIDLKEENIRRLAQEVNELRNKRIKLEKDLDELHFISPEPGDFWHEMYTPFFIVLSVENDFLTICKKTKTIYEEPDQNMVLKSYENPNNPEVKEYFSRPRKDIGYTFDINETITVSRSEFEKMLKCYSFTPEKLAYKCIPGRAKELVKIWKEKT